MRQKRSVFVNRASLKRRRVIGKVLTGALVLILLSLIPLIYVKVRGQNGNERKELRAYFEAKDFETAYAQSGELLKEKPLDISLLTIHGFSAYQIADAQINNSDTQKYMDDCIWALRRALLLDENPAVKRILGSIFYVLGKAYFCKGAGYADLAVSYLEKARDASFMAGDIPEYLGMAYMEIRDFRSSVAAFTLALNEDDTSDKLLISIARSYLALGEYESARAYLIRCLDISRDYKAIAAARLLLGDILVKTGSVEEAEAEYLRVIEENGDNAEAHFQLGELYASMGDNTRARAEWRRATRIDPAHALARSRLQ